MNFFSSLPGQLGALCIASRRSARMTYAVRRPEARRNVLVHSTPKANIDPINAINIIR
jgi:hypothetical protein